MLYCKEIVNHKLGDSTPSKKIADSLGWTITIEESEVEKAYDGSYWEKGYAPEKTKTIKEEEVKLIRNSILESIEWRVDRAREQKELGIICVDNYNELLEYKQYLRDYPDKTKNWWEQEPKTFEDWRKECQTSISEQ